MCREVANLKDIFFAKGANIMAKSIRYRWYSVEMPDGNTYAACGRSRVALAERHMVDVKQVKNGVDLLQTPDILQYYVHKRRQEQI